MDNHPLVALLLADPDTDTETWSALGEHLPGAVATAVWQVHAAADPARVREVVDAVDITAVPYDRALPVHAALVRSRRSSLAAALLERADPGALTYLLKHADPVPAPLVRWVMNTEHRDALLVGATAVSLLDAPTLRPQHAQMTRDLAGEARDPGTARRLRERIQVALTVDAARTSTADYTLQQLTAALELADVADVPGIVRGAREQVAGGTPVLAAVVDALDGRLDPDVLHGVLTPVELGTPVHDVPAAVAARACHDHPSTRPGWWDLALRALADGTPGPAHLVVLGARPPAAALPDLVRAAVAGLAGGRTGDQGKDLVLVLAAHLRGREEPEAETARAVLREAATAPGAPATARVAALLLDEPAALAMRPLTELAEAAGADTGTGTGLWLLADVLLGDPDVRAALAELRSSPGTLATALRAGASTSPLSVPQLRDVVGPTD
ncbi:hypothetical protein [Cellulomonas marina]|uniref:Uncharacterized protein n=1 Tax=Cellulomonas marina TaxID=988821 RepID=A0A1I0W4M2_9CELL|nr:hypothetical protein [Cellulomonas marina]GIG30002.1 hypothetical protein Cma02nite_26020 [Cellulomonas marina]SFA83715.1 hypothetical protein SAMN05421867_102185 [Cellulomonas marina]